MNIKSTQFVIGDTVRLTRAIGRYPAGTIGTVVRADNDGWVWTKVSIDKEHNERFIMAVDWCGSVVKEATTRK